MKKFDRALSLKIDQLVNAIEQAKANRQPARVAGLSARLSLLEREISVCQPSDQSTLRSVPTGKAD